MINYSVDFIGRRCKGCNGGVLIRIDWWCKVILCKL